MVVIRQATDCVVMLAQQMDGRSVAAVDCRKKTGIGTSPRRPAGKAASSSADSTGNPPRLCSTPACPRRIHKRENLGLARNVWFASPKHEEPRPFQGEALRAAAESGPHGGTGG